MKRRKPRPLADRSVKGCAELIRKVVATFTSLDAADWLEFEIGGDVIDFEAERL